MGGGVMRAPGMSYCCVERYIACIILWEIDRLKICFFILYDNGRQMDHFF